MAIHVTRRAAGPLVASGYYIGDQRPGEILCQAVQEFGGLWYVVSPAGRAIL